MTAETAEQKPPGIINDDGKRRDGRGCEQVRSQMFMKLGVLSQAKGSAFAEMGRTKVLAAVYGPKPTESRREFSELGVLNAVVKFASFATPTRGHVSKSSKTGIEFSNAVREAFSSVIILSRYPKTVIDIHINVMEAGGSDLSIVMMAASMALCDAGIEMTGVVTAASVITFKEHMLIDPAAEEEFYQDRSVIVAMLAQARKVVHMDISGVFNATELKTSMDLALSACIYFDARLRPALLDRLQKQIPPSAIL